MKEVFILKRMNASERIVIIGVYATRQAAEKCIISKGYVTHGNYYINPSMMSGRTAWIQNYPVITGSYNAEAWNVAQDVEINLELSEGYDGKKKESNYS